LLLRYSYLDFQFLTEPKNKFLVGFAPKDVLFKKRGYLFDKHKFSLLHQNSNEMTSAADEKLYNYLQQAGLGDFYGNFKKVGIRFDNISGLSLQDYHKVGITSKQEKKKLFEVIQQIKRNMTPSPSQGT